MTPLDDSDVPIFLSGLANAPPFAALEVVSIGDVAGEDIYTVRQPTGEASATLLFNGPSELDSGSYGGASNRSQVRGLAGVASGQVGPVAGSWSLEASAETKTHRVIGGARGGSYRLEKLSSSGGLAATYRAARIISSVAATAEQNNGLEITLGTIIGSELFTPQTLPIDEFAHSETQAYVAGDIVKLPDGTVHKGNSANIGAGPFIASEWRQMTGEFEVQGRPTVTVRSRITANMGSPVAGGRVEWIEYKVDGVIDQRIFFLSCEPIVGLVT